MRVDLVVVVAQGVAETAIDMRRDVRGDVGHRLVAGPDRAFGDPREAALDGVDRFRIGGEPGVVEPNDIACDPLGILDDVLDPQALALGQHPRKPVPGPGRSGPASARCGRVRRPDRPARAAVCAVFR